MKRGPAKGKACSENGAGGQRCRNRASERVSHPTLPMTLDVCGTHGAKYERQGWKRQDLWVVRGRDLKAKGWPRRAKP